LFVNNLSHILCEMASNEVGSRSSVTNAQNGDICDEVCYGSFLEEFREAKEVTTIISSLSEIYKDQIAVERALERFQRENSILVASYSRKLLIA